MSLRLGAVLLALALAAGLPIQASADDRSDAIMAAKGFDFEGNDSPPDLVDENSMPTVGDAPGTGVSIESPGRRRGVQVNNPALDNIQFFPEALPQPQRPFELSIQSETSAAAFGDDVVVGFNNSADQPVVQLPDGKLAFVHRFLSAVGTSHDGGRTWTESSLPPIPGSPFTSGDPAVTVDRSGNFYYASLGADAPGHSLVFVGKSTDRGTTFHPGVTVAVDPGVDKEWIGAGPDPLHPERDNVYVTWTSFKADSSELHFSRSTDGGQTWSAAQTLFAPVKTTLVSAFIQFSNTVVDRESGRLYVPFLHGGAGSADFIKVLISDDGGLTFRFSNFNMPGAPDTTAFPNVTPGTLADCGLSGGRRLVLHVGLDLGGGRFGLPVFRNATRLITQPSTVVQRGKVFIAYNASTSPTAGDPKSRSEIRLLFSPNGGSTWQGPVVVARATTAEPQHVHPAVSVNESGSRVTVGYYSQLANGQLQVNAATADVDGEESRFTLGDRQVKHLGPPFDLTPSNNPLSDPFPAHTTTNYDRTIRPCYDIGEYMTATRSLGTTVLAYGDNRNSWVSPPQSPVPGTHSQPDVFANRFNSND